jgi:hypothetical protein
MRRFRFSSWKFMLVMFVLITIFFYDLGYNETEKPKPPNETNSTSNTPSENDIEAMQID